MTTKRRLFRHLPLIFAGFAMSLGVFLSIKSHSLIDSVQPSEAAAPSNYYSSVTDGMTGSTLQSKLKTIISSNVSVSYNWDRYKDADEDPNNSNNIIAVYSRRSLPKSSTDPGREGDYWNREHTFPNSKITGNAESDNHIIFASEKKVNGARSSLKMGVVTNGTVVNDNNGNATTCQKTSNLFDPHNLARGIVARSTMYAATLYDLDPSDNFESIATMLRWHLEYQPDSNDMRRNDAVYTNQGNRNPFVDHPEYACRIWGSTNSTTQSICNSSTSGSISISKTSANLTVGESTTIYATSSDSSTITWSTSNSSVASISSTSSNSGSNITITGSSEGTATIKAKATIGGNNYEKTCEISVSSSGSGGEGDSSYSLVTNISSLSNGDEVVLTTNQSSNPVEGVTGWNGTNDATVSTSSTNWVKYVVGGKSNSGFTLLDTSANSYIARPTDNHFKYSSTAGTISVEEDGKFLCNSRYLCKNGTYYRCYTSVNSSYSPFYIYKVNSSSAKTLSSISISTPPTKTSYTVGQNFDPTGLVIKRNYSDSTNDTYTYSGHTSEFTFDPSLSTALTVSHTSVAITYGGKTCYQTITVNQPTITSISAVANKTFYVGETISASDITVKDNNNNVVSSFTFSNDGYQFTYEDAASGGSLTNKTFTNAISGAGKTCSLSVQVRRKEYATSSSVKDTITASDLPATGTTYTDFDNVKRTSAAVYAGQSAKDNDGNIQLRSKNSNSGIVSTTSGGSIQQVVITVGSGSNTINVYGTNSAYSSASDLFGSSKGTLVGSVTSTGTVTFTTSYTFVGICSASGAIYISEIDIYYAGTSETPSNVANYIMFEDTENQCTTKLNKAIGYLGNLSSSDRLTFANSNDYVIATARERLNAWATSQGKTINFTSGTMTNRNGISALNSNENNSEVILSIVISVLGVSFIAMHVYLRKKREN